MGRINKFVVERYIGTKPSQAGCVGRWLVGWSVVSQTTPAPAIQHYTPIHIPCEECEELKIMDCLKWIFPTQSSSKLIFHAKFDVPPISVYGEDSVGCRFYVYRRSGNGIPIYEERVWSGNLFPPNYSQFFIGSVRKDSAALWSTVLLLLLFNLGGWKY